MGDTETKEINDVDYETVCLLDAKEFDFPSHRIATRAGNIESYRLCWTILKIQAMSEPSTEAMTDPIKDQVDGEPSGPSNSELKKRAKEAKKAKKAADRAAREEEEKIKREAAASMDNAAQNYGKLPLHQSQERQGEAFLLWVNPS